ncbi:MAG: glycosyltransferase family 2 protein [Lachnospiraceae bacterium]|nr:glycosyltransferase family 2 protein [Lachnospiraceae bacterium]
MGLSGALDVLIPVYEPDESFEKLLKMLSNQTVRPEKIILMVTEGSHEVALDEQNDSKIEIHRLQKTEFDHAGTRNAAVSFSDAELVLFMTQDAVPEDVHFIEELVEGMEQDEKIAVSYARQLAKKDTKPIERLIRRFNYPEESRMKSLEDLEELGIKTYFCSDVAAVYRREIFTELGGFETPAVFNEDMVFAAKAVKAGYKVYYNAEARVVHAHNLKLMEQFRRNFDVGASQADHPEVFEEISSESEGGKLFKTVSKGLVKLGRWYLLPYFILQCGAKFIGFRLGKRYPKLKPGFVKKCSSNRAYWERFYGQNQSNAE